jgi:hypothetical protein
MDLRKQPDQLEDRLEACRPDSQDISANEMREAAAALAADGELARRFDLQQAYDARLADGMRQVEAPHGLADRILARLAQNEPDKQAGAEKASPNQTTAEIAAPLALDSEFTAAESASAESTAVDNTAVDNTAVEQSDSQSSLSTLVTPVAAEMSRFPARRKLLVAIVTLAASLLLAVVGYQWWAGPQWQVTPDQFQKQALRWRDSVKPLAWKTDLASFRKFEQQYPLNHMRVHPTGYQTIQTQLQGDQVPMIVYNYSSPQGAAYLFAAQTPYSTLGMSDGLPPSRSEELSAGWHMASWREGPLLYVLLHKGGLRQYEQLVDTLDAIARTDRREDQLLALSR